MLWGAVIWILLALLSCPRGVNMVVSARSVARGARYSFPETIRPVIKRQSHELSNAERFARGFPLPKPARLYDASRVHSAPKARLSPAPLTASGYAFQGCFAGAQGTTGVAVSESVLAATTADGAVACASWASGAGMYDFIVYDTLSVDPVSGETWFVCEGPMSGTLQQSCTSTNNAWYHLP